MDTIDLNADLGEATTPDGIVSELAILDVISSANIACGGHAGTTVSMRRMVRAAKDKGVTIGAHPAYPDVKNFGRVSKVLGKDISTEDLKQTLTQQIENLIAIADEETATIAYVKPHGALYNDAVFDAHLATLIAETIFAVSPQLFFMGAPNSEMTHAASKLNLQFISEAFIDRRYTDDGHLQSRTVAGAVIQDQAARMAQVESLVLSGTVTTASSATLPISAQSLCLHGDSAGAIETARLARSTIESFGIRVESFGA